MERSHTNEAPKLQPSTPALRIAVKDLELWCLLLIATLVMLFA